MVCLKKVVNKITPMIEEASLQPGTSRLLGLVKLHIVSSIKSSAIGRSNFWNIIAYMGGTTKKNSSEYPSKILARLTRQLSNISQLCIVSKEGGISGWTELQNAGVRGNS